jgi:hypothetical protein
MSLLRPQTSGGIFNDDEFSDLSHSSAEDNDETRHIATAHTNHSSLRPMQMVSSSGEYWQSTDQVIESIPLGKFQYRLLWVCGLALMADGMVGPFSIAQSITRGIT